MDLRLRADLDVPPARVLAEVGDLPAYPSWLGVVRRVEADGDGWLVEVGARVGPITRSKRVRMVPAEAAEGAVRFERDEGDGRPHGRWLLEAAVDPPAGEGPCRLELHLLYEGSSPLVGLLEPLLRAEAGRSAARLRRRLTDPSATA